VGGGLRGGGGVRRRKREPNAIDDVMAMLVNLESKSKKTGVGGGSGDALAFLERIEPGRERTRRRSSDGHDHDRADHGGYARS